MAKITVERGREGEYHVIVNEGGSRTTHTVSVDDGYYRKLTDGNIPREELVRRSFEFLLAREPKESILGTFDLPVIARYFGEYEGEMRRRG
jgi:hypothetical protein